MLRPAAQLFAPPDVDPRHESRKSYHLACGSTPVSLEPLDVEDMTVRELWGQHMSHKFPARLRGREIGGIDLVMLDADVAGCVQSFVERRALDSWRVSVLRKCIEHLAVVLPQLSEQERDYFAHVETMARTVLSHVSSEPTPN